MEEAPMSITTPEATTLPQQDAALEPPPVSGLPLTAGDAAQGMEVAAPEHGGAGDWFIFLSNLTAIGMGVGAAGAMLGLVFGLFAGDGKMMGITMLAAVGLAIGCVVQSTLAKHVKHFSRWGWWGAMAELTVATLAKVVALASDPGSFMGPAIGLTIDAVWLRYFWERRQDFDIDLDF
jgi:hypothetical protein